MKKIIILLLTFFIFNPIYSQTIEELNWMLDSAKHNKYAGFYSYSKTNSLPDSLKKKIIAVLNGYLPPNIYKKAYNFSSGQLKHFAEIAKRKCQSDLECVKRTTDSLKERYALDNIEIAKKTKYTDGFILSLANWNIQEAKQILWDNRRNNNTFPKIPTYMALSKFGYSEAVDSLLKIMHVDAKSKEATNMTTEYIYKKIDELEDITSFLKYKKFYYNILDLFDIETFGFGYDVVSDDNDIYLSEYNVLGELVGYGSPFYRKAKNQEAKTKLNELKEKWDQMMPHVSNNGFKFMSNLCAWSIVLDIDETTIEAVEHVCSGVFSDMYVNHLVNTLKYFCTNDIIEDDVLNYIQMRMFRELGLKEQLKAELRDWIDKYIVFDE